MTSASIRKLLLPFSWIYYAVTSARNYFYDTGILKSAKFTIPVICVGNLNTGGTGKTPHVEYIIRLLKNNYRIATLSRGYGRKSEGFFLVTPEMAVEISGDEPYQYAMKFPEIIVSVSEDRVNAIKNLLLKSPAPEIIILDDGFQHRAVNPGLSVLLTEYSNLFTKDHLLPAGNLRENQNGYKRADLIVVTKCAQLSEKEKQNLVKEISPMPHQQVLFSYLHYEKPVVFSGTNSEIEFHQLKEYHVLLVTGIANPLPLVEFLKTAAENLVHLKFPDHHIFSKTDMKQLQIKFDNIAARKKIILTTEKDFIRLSNVGVNNSNLPFYYLPVKIYFDNDDKKIFDDKILSYVGKN